MAEKELRRLNRRELLRLLLIQCEEMERVQREHSEMKADLEAFTESYERLKVKLNIKDERLNEKDARIAELTQMIEELRGVEAEEPLANDMEEAELRVNRIFEEAKRRADEYLKNSIKIADPFAPALEPEDRKRRSLVQLGRRTTAYSESRNVVPLAAAGDRNG